MYGELQRHKHENHARDERFSVTVLVSGSAAGIVGPVVIIAEGDKVSAGFETSAALAAIGAPAGSFVVANASAYMTVATMENIIERFCVALRESDPVVAQHLWPVRFRGQQGAAGGLACGTRREAGCPLTDNAPHKAGRCIHRRGAGLSSG